MDNERASLDFERTDWSLVRQAGKDTPSDAGQALEEFCRRYWPPIYAHVRRQGYSPEDSKDLTQEFFLRLLSHRSLAAANPQKGRFRSFLLGALKHFLADAEDWRHAGKRGGGCSMVSLDDVRIQDECLHQLLDDSTPGRLCQRHRAWTLCEHALQRLQEESHQAGKDRLFEALKPLLLSEPRTAGCAAVAGDLHLQADAVAVLLHRLRRRFRTLIRQELAQSVSSPAELEEELRDLFG